MRVVIGNLWDGPETYKAVTTNSTIQSNRLVMGAGSALEAKQRYYDVPALAVEMMKIKESETHLYYVREYNILVIEKYKLILFQTKYLYAEKSNLQLIIRSMKKLSQWVTEHNVTVGLAYPGIGYGRIPESTISVNISPYVDERITLYKKG